MRAPPTFAEIRDEIEAENHEQNMRQQVVAYATDCVECGLTFTEIANLLRGAGHELSARDIRAMCVAQWLEEASEAPLN